MPEDKDLARVDGDTLSEGPRTAASDIEDFVRRVNARAEAEMLAGRPVTGAHHRAIEAELTAYRLLPRSRRVSPNYLEELERCALDAVDHWTMDTPASYAQRDDGERLKYKLWIAVKRIVEREREKTCGTGGSAVAADA